MAKIISVEEAIAMIPDGATIMFGGFLGCGSAHHIIDALSKSCLLYTSNWYYQYKGNLEAAGSERQAARAILRGKGAVWPCTPPPTGRLVSARPLPYAP